MAQEALFPEELFIKFINALSSWSKNNKEDKGLPEGKEGRFTDNVLPKKEQERVKDRLEGNEIRRMQSIGKVLAQSFFDLFQSKQKDVKASTIVSESKSKVDKGNKIPEKMKGMDINYMSILSQIAIIGAGMLAIRLYIGKIADIIIPISYAVLKSKKIWDLSKDYLEIIRKTGKSLDGLTELRFGTKIVNNFQKWVRNTNTLLRSFFNTSEALAEGTTSFQRVLIGLRGIGEALINFLKTNTKITAVLENISNLYNRGIANIQKLLPALSGTKTTGIFTSISTFFTSSITKLQDFLSSIKVAAKSFFDFSNNTSKTSKFLGQASDIMSRVWKSIQSLTTSVTEFTQPLLKVINNNSRLSSMLSSAGKLMGKLSNTMSSIQKWFGATSETVTAFVKGGDMLGRSVTAIKGFGTGIAIFIGKFLSFSTVTTKVTQVVSSTGGLLANAAKAVGTKLAPFLKKIPLVGSLISFGFAYSYFKGGRIIRGIVELLSGIGALLIYTGVGAAVGIPLQLAALGVGVLMDLLEDKSETARVSTWSKIAKTGLYMLLRKAAVKYGLKFARVLKFIPFVGGVVGLGLSYMRFKEGDWFGGIVELISAAADFVPVVGNAISFVLDGALILYDILRTPEKESKKVEPKKEGGGFMGAVKKTASMLGNGLLKGIRYMPLIGNLFSFGTGVSSLMRGDFKNGITDILKGMLLFLPPGVTDVLLSGVGFILGLFDGDEKENKPPEIKKISFMGAIKSYISKKLENLPFFIKKPLEWLGILSKKEDEVEAVKGNMKAPSLITGVKNYIREKLSTLPFVLRKPLEWLGILNKKEEEEEAINEAKKAPSLIRGVKNYIKEKLSVLPFVLRKPLEWLGIVNTKEDQEEGNPESGKKISFSSAIKKYISSKMKKLPFWMRKPLEWLGILKEDVEEEESDNSKEKGGERKIDNSDEDKTKKESPVSRILLIFNRLVDALEKGANSVVSKVDNMNLDSTERIKTNNTVDIERQKNAIAKDNIDKLFKGDLQGLLENKKKVDELNKPANKPSSVNTFIEQNKLIKDQNSILYAILEVSKQHFLLDKGNPRGQQQASATPVVIPDSTNTPQIGSNLDSRALFVKSPYSLAPS